MHLFEKFIEEAQVVETDLLGNLQNVAVGREHELFRYPNANFIAEFNESLAHVLLKS